MFVNLIRIYIIKLWIFESNNSKYNTPTAANSCVLLDGQKQQPSHCCRGGTKGAVDPFENKQQFHPYSYVGVTKQNTQ